MLQRTTIFPALFVAIAVAIAGCGGGDDDGGDATVTKASFIKEAEEICRKAAGAEEQQQGEFVQQNLQRIKREPPPPNDKATYEIVETIRVPIILKEIEDLEALEPPEGDEEKLQQIFTKSKKALKELDEKPELVWADTKQNPLYPSYKMAREYGFSICAES